MRKVGFGISKIFKNYYTIFYNEKGEFVCQITMLCGAMPNALGGHGQVHLTGEMESMNVSEC